MNPGQPKKYFGLLFTDPIIVLGHFSKDLFLLLFINSLA